MKNVLKIIPIFIVIGAFIDNNFNLLKDLGLSDNAGNWIKFLGLILTSLLPSVFNTAKPRTFAKAEDTLNPDNPQFPKGKY